RLEGGEVPFSRLRAEFTRTASRIEFRDAVIAGMQVGFTLGGWLDYGRDRADPDGQSSLRRRAGLPAQAVPVRDRGRRRHERLAAPVPRRPLRGAAPF